MQCEGITQAGHRCRNKALEYEIFCEIHMRVNRTFNLALLVPFLTTLLLCYFFLFGLYFETLIYGIFDLNYLKYAGLADFFITMFRNGGMLIIVIFKIWAIYSAVIAVIFGVWLLVHMIILTSRKHLKFAFRMKIIGLSMGIFILNFLHMFLVLIPKRRKDRPSQLLIGREHLVRSLERHKSTMAPVIGQDPRQIAAVYYRRFVAIATFNNHRFFITLLILTLTASASVLYAGHEARKMRACIIDIADEKIAVPPVDTAKLYPGLNITTLCEDGTDTTHENISLIRKFSKTLRGFFDFPVVLLKKGQTTTPLLYLGSTSRFEMFFNGATRLPFTVSTQNLGPLFAEPSAEDMTRQTELLSKLGTLQTLALKNSTDIETLGKKAAAGQAVDTHSLERKLGALAKSAATSGRNLQDLRLGLDRVATALQEVEIDHTRRIVETIPAYCWDIAPHLVIEFDVGSTAVTDAETTALIRRLAEVYREAGSHFIVISGHSDPSGPVFDNYRLSRERAAAVMAEMIGAGLAKSDVYMIGRGEDSSTTLPRRRAEIRDCTLRPEEATK